MIAKSSAGGNSLQVANMKKTHAKEHLKRQEAAGPKDSPLASPRHEGCLLPKGASQSERHTKTNMARQESQLSAGVAPGPEKLPVSSGSEP